MEYTNNIEKNNKKKLIKCSIIIAILIIIGIFLYWQNNDLVISTYNFSSEKASGETDGYKIVNISDLHNKTFGKDNEKLVDKVRNKNPDMIVITGDIVDSGSKGLDIAISVTKKFSEIAPVYYVTGNHEKTLNIELYQKLEEGLKDSGVNVLYNDVVKINDMFYLVGLDEDKLKNENIDKTAKLLFELEQVPEDALKVLLAHEPQLVDKYTDFDVVFSGHAHGGQIRIPFINLGLIAPDQGLYPKYTAGKYTVESTTMYVSRGLGNSILPFRIFNRPEIVEVILNCEK